MNKKILIDARMYGLENAGIGRYLINLLSELKKKKTQYEFIVLLRKKYFADFDCPSKWTKVNADFGHYGITEQIELPRILNKLKPDLVHFPHLNIPLLWKGNFIVTIHDLTMQRQSVNATKLPLPIYYLKRLPFLLIASKAVKESKKIIVPSNFVKDDIGNYYNIDKSKIATVYEGFDQKVQKSKAGEKALAKYGIEKPYLFYVGNAYPHKNIKKAMEAVKIQNLKSKEKLHFYIAGSRNLFTHRVNDDINILNMSKYIHHIGYVEDTELDGIYRNSLGFLYSSISEGFGLQGLEAISSGTILLCSDIPVFRELFADHAFYFDPKRPDSIAGTIEKLCKISESERESLIRSSQNYIKKFSWQKMAQETFSLYESCVSL